MLLFGDRVFHTSGALQPPFEDDPSAWRLATHGTVTGEPYRGLPDPSGIFGGQQWFVPVTLGDGRELNLDSRILHHADGRGRVTIQ